MSNAGRHRAEARHDAPLRQAETERLAGDLSRHIGASYVPAEPGRRIAAGRDLRELSRSQPAALRDHGAVGHHCKSPR